MDDTAHPRACICCGKGTVERGPAGATYSVPCPGPPDMVRQYGVEYVRSAEGTYEQAVAGRAIAEALERFSQSLRYAAPETLGELFAELNSATRGHIAVFAHDRPHQAEEQERSSQSETLTLPGLRCPSCGRLAYDRGGGRACWKQDDRGRPTTPCGVMQPVTLTATASAAQAPAATEAAHGR